MMYFDNAATTQMSEAAINALINVSKEQYGNPSSIYKLGIHAKDILDESRLIIARCIGASPEEIFFTSGGTESDNWVIRKLGKIVRRVIVSNIEHHAVLLPADDMQKDGCHVVFVETDNEGRIDLDTLQTYLDGTKTLVSIMYQNNETGIIQDIPNLSALVHSDNSQSLFHTDAVQAIGHLPINVNELDIDFLSASAHKFNGPKGVGFLYKRNSCTLQPLLAGGGQEKGLRSGTENVAGIYSMAKALEDNIDNMEKNLEHIHALEERFLYGLSNANIDYIINGNTKYKASGILNIAINGIDGEGLLNMLDLHNICISIGSACNSRTTERSHVLKAMHISDERIDSSVRISIGKYNNEREIDMLVNYIASYYKTVGVAHS